MECHLPLLRILIFYARHNALHEFNDGLMVVMIALQGVSPSKHEHLKAELHNEFNLV